MPHAAFDRNVLGIRPDVTVAIREDVLEEVDEPMPAHDLKDSHTGRSPTSSSQARARPRLRSSMSRLDSEATSSSRLNP